MKSAIFKFQIAILECKLEIAQVTSVKCDEEVDKIELMYFFLICWADLISSKREGNGNFFIRLGVNMHFAKVSLFYLHSTNPVQVASEIFGKRKVVQNLFSDPFYIEHFAIIFSDNNVL